MTSIAQPEGYRKDIPGLYRYLKIQGLVIVVPCGWRVGYFGMCLDRGAESVVCR